MQHDAAVLKVPASADYARAVRMLAANLAVTAELNVDEVEDLRMAAEEGFVYACATEPSQVEVRFSIDRKSMEIEFGLGEKPAESSDDPSLEYASLLLSALCDVFEINEAERLLRIGKTGIAL